jgi:hypothetical protein
MSTINAKSYTYDMVDTMIRGLEQAKYAHGFTRLVNGLYQDCAGQVYAGELLQKKTIDADGDELLEIVFKLTPVSIMGRL